MFDYSLIARKPDNFRKVTFDQDIFILRKKISMVRVLPLNTFLLQFWFSKKGSNTYQNLCHFQQNFQCSELIL